MLYQAKSFLRMDEMSGTPMRYATEHDFYLKW